jgi:hypothetical protein
MRPTIGGTGLSVAAVHTLIEIKAVGRAVKPLRVESGVASDLASSQRGSVRAPGHGEPGVS